MTERKQNDILKQALKLYKNDQFKHIPSEENIDYIFSESFNQKMSVLLNGKSTYNINRRLSKKILIAIAAVILMISLSLSVTAFRKYIVDFFCEIFSTNIHTFYEGSEKGELSEYFLLPSLPEGYTKCETNSIDTISVDLSYENDYGGTIHFFQTKSGIDGRFSSEGGEVKEIEVNGISVLYCNNNVDIYCTWIEHDTYFQLIYPHFLTDDYMYRIIGRLEETKPVPEEQ